MGFDEKNELDEFDFSKEIGMPDEMDTGSIAENVQTITESSVGMEEMELYDDNSTKVMDAIPHSSGVISDLQLLPEDDEADVGMTMLMPEAEELSAEEFGTQDPGAQELSDYGLSYDSLEVSEPEILQEDISLTGKAEEELGDLSYHDEDVEIPHRERRNPEHRVAAHRSSEHRSAEHREGEHRRPEHRNGEHRTAEHRNGEHRRLEQRSAEHKRPAGASEHKAKSAQHTASRKPSNQHTSSSQGYKGPRIQKEEKRKFGLFDMILIGGGAVVLIFLAIFLVVFLRKNSYNHKVENIAEIGEKLASLNGVGSTGIDGIVAHRTTATIDSIADDEEAGPSVDISVNFSSMEKDLKIKFSDKVTDELITGVLFKVEAKSPDNKELTWSDDDKDGIIYEENLKPGIYKVKIASVDQYKFPDKETDVTVKEKISYTAINIVNEIKKEKDINVALEDGRVNEIDTGTQLQDTVAWVESSQKSSYKEIARSEIKEPVLAMVVSSKSYSAEPNTSDTNPDTTEPANPEDPDPKDDPDPTPDPSEKPDSSEIPTPEPEKKNPVTNATLSSSSGLLIVGETLSIKCSVTPSDADATIEFSSTDPTVATVAKDTGLVTAVKSGTTQITCKVIGKDNGGVPIVPDACVITVKDGYVTGLKINNPVDQLSVGKEYTFNTTVDVKGSATKEVKWTCSSAEYATILDAKAGKVKITKATPTGTKVDFICQTVGKGADEKELTAKCSVSTTATIKDPDAQLKSKNTNEDIYVKDGETFRLAKNSDYNKYNNFYIKATIYTGWQTVNGKTQYYKNDGNYVTGEQVIGGVKYNFASDGSLSMGGGSRGIDVSSWNGNINWTAVKNSGVSFVIIRCGYRGYTQGGLIEDSKFHSYASGAEAAGLKVGVYFFSQATNEREAVEEASMAIAMAKSHKISYPIFIDSEYGAANHNGRADKLDKATRTACIKAFCETVRSAGYTPGVYASKSWYYNNLDAGQLNNYKIWLAHYCAQTDYKGKYELWQSSNTGRINGISGNVDINTSYLGY